MARWWMASPARVAGVQTPAFVERSRAMRSRSRCPRVAGVQTRPSLSGVQLIVVQQISLVSPEFRLRPSLSGRERRHPIASRKGVAGVQTPAFVERSSTVRRDRGWSGVAGVQTPAFVERSRRFAQAGPRRGGVAGVQTPAFVERSPRWRWQSARSRVAGVQTPAFVERCGSARVGRRCSGVAGVQTPAFVERSRRSQPMPLKLGCRRSSDSGLR